MQFQLLTVPPWQVSGLSKSNGLVNGYLNGYISRPNCTSAERETIPRLRAKKQHGVAHIPHSALKLLAAGKALFRTLADATEDSEFAVRHYAKARGTNSMLATGNVVIGLRSA